MPGKTQEGQQASHEEEGSMFNDAQARKVETYTATERAASHRIPMPFLQPREFRHGQDRQEAEPRVSALQGLWPTLPDIHKL
jgi:hypothetical protein